MGITIGTAVITSLFIVWLLMPSPKLPLTDDQLNTFYNGQFFNEFWSKLSKKEQDHLTNLAKISDVNQSNGDNASNNHSNSGDNQ